MSLCQCVVWVLVSSWRVSRQCRRIMCPLLSLAVAVAAVVVVLVLVGVVVVAPFLLLLLLLAAAVLLLRKRIGFRCTCARQKRELRYSCSKALVFAAYWKLVWAKCTAWYSGIFGRFLASLGAKQRHLIFFQYLFAFSKPRSCWNHRNHRK